MSEIDTTVLEACEVARIERARHVFKNRYQCQCEYLPDTATDWGHHVADAIAMAVVAKMRGEWVDPRS